MTCFKLPSVCKVCILLYILILVTGCNSIPSAVVLAGDNRGEIIKALKYYHNDDPLKHKAVKYLISGMPLHHSYGGSINDFNDALDSLLVMGLSKEDYLSAEKHQYDKFSSSFEICTDLKTIKAEEIIMNVEASFDLWGNGGWADHLDFKEFCKYLLPYKFVELQPLEDWKNQHRGLFSKNLYSVGAECKENNGNPVAAIKAILSELGEIPKSSAEYKSYPIFNPQTILKRPTASCRDFCYAMAGVFLSKGIPVSIDYTPQWGDRKNNHQWMTVLTKRHKNEEFGIDQYAEEYEFLRRRIMPKVYRVSYLPDREMTRRLLLGWTIPVSLGNIFFEDVSDQYLKTDNMCVR